MRSRRCKRPLRGFMPSMLSSRCRAHQIQKTYLLQDERPLLKGPGLRPCRRNDFEDVALGQLDPAAPVPGEHLPRRSVGGPHDAQEKEHHSPERACSTSPLGGAHCTLQWQEPGSTGTSTLNLPVSKPRTDVVDLWRQRHRRHGGEVWLIMYAMKRISTTRR